MQNTLRPQIAQNVFELRRNLEKNQQPTGSVWQDKIALRRDREASGQPAAPIDPSRSHKQSKNTHRLQNSPTLQQKTVPITLHVRPIIKDRLARIAEREGLKTTGKEPLSLSEVGGKYLDRGLQEDMDMQYGALLEPVIERIMEKYMGAMRNQLRWLLVRVAFDANQTRSLVTNIFSRQPGITKEARERILVESAKAAKTNIFGKTPQLKELVEKLDLHMGVGNNAPAAR